MLPFEAKQALRDMGVISENHLGFFRVVRRPRLADLDLFVLAIKSLGAYSVQLGDYRAPVYVSSGDRANELVFRVERSR